MNEPAVVSDPSAADARLYELVRESPFALLLVRLSDSELLEVSRPLEVWAQRSRAELIGMRMLDYVVDREVAHRSLSLLAAGVLDAYTRRPVYNRPDGSTQAFEARFTVCADQSPRRTAVAMILPDESEPPAAMSLHAPPVGGEVSVLGTVDSHWVIDRVTSDVTTLLGHPASEVLGRSALDLVHPEDVASVLLLAAYAGERPAGTCGRVRIRTADDDWILCRVGLHPLAGQGPLAFAFALSPITATHTSDGPRARELEEHLRRIAREIAASGVAALSTTMPTSIEMPELSRLTSREYEIVVRLASGDRVPSIARGLFLSESTVRNHLTSVYRKVGVHSQDQLLARLHAIA
ncbi:MAG: Response regulator containing a CheY-like receiver domain and an DNA-binding domain [Frankiales bacterium]|nr:Response regulator containing a CheY-like receiver domain and an DNA-binding domain [Frankiales bacterium]